jgi:hypothetical protein
MSAASPLPDQQASPHRTIAAWLWLLGAAMLACLLMFIVMTRHWPMVGDAALMRYGLFLVQHGLTPYKDFVEINLPGAYFTDSLVTHIFGTGGTGWRCYDLSLLLLAGLCMQALAGRGERIAAGIAGGLFALAHGADGIAQAGQRDLAIAVLLCAGLVCLLRALQTRRVTWMACFGLLHGWAAIIKPTAALITVPCFLAALFYLRRDRKPVVAPAIVAVSAYLLPGCLAAIYLWSHHALSAFWFVVHVLLPYHAQLSRRPLSYLLLHSLSPFVSLVALWCVSLFVGHRWLQKDARRTLLIAASLGGLAIYIAQGKGFPYHRYPFLIFLLPLIFFDGNRLLHSPRKPAMFLALATFVVGVFVLAPMSLARIRRYNPQDVFRDALVQDLNRLGGSALNRRVQCLDTVQGCIATLGQMKLEQATGLVYDEFLFEPVPGMAIDTAIDTSRARFWQEIHAQPPSVFIVVDGYFLSSDDHYAKLDQWPAFSEFLSANYHLYAERPSPGMVRWWGRAQPAPGYRIYVRNVVRNAAAEPPSR